LQIYEWICRRIEARERAALLIANQLLRVLDLRGIALTPEQRAGILKCTAPARLDAWFDRAVLAHTADDVFQPPIDAK
jgi:hypothetical protein